MRKLKGHVWEKNKLEVKTKIAVCRACELSVLVYGRDSWITYTTRERTLISVHLRNLIRIHGIRCYHQVTNNEVISSAGIESTNAFLTQKRFRRPGHVHRMDNG